jgi:hypothetical protein
VRHVAFVGEIGNADTFYSKNTSGRVSKEYIEVDVKITLKKFKKGALSIRLYLSNGFLKHDKAKV